MLIVLLVHGLVDDPLYSHRAALLFMLAPSGLITGMWRITAPATPAALPSPRGRRAWLIGAVLVALLLAGALLARRPLTAAWHANLGALSQTRAEMTVYDEAHFDRLSLDAVRRQVDTRAAEAHLAQALALDPGNVTATQRLAMLARARGDYSTSLALLERIAALGASDRITRLLLGDALVADGQVARAAQIVTGLPFAKARLGGLASDFSALGDAKRATWAGEAAAQVPE